MDGNKHLGIVNVKNGESSYVFKGVFSTLAALQDREGDLIAVYEKVNSGGCDLFVIKNVISCCMDLKNGETVNDKDAEAEYLIESHGLQECIILCQHLLAYAMIGDEKKSKLHKLKPSKLTQLITEPFKLESSKNRRLLWAYHFLISGVSVCASFSLYGLLIA